MRHRNNGFSLIELMVVIAIVAVLAAIAVPSYKNYAIRSRIASVANLLSTLTYPAIVYRNKYGVWPAPDTNPALSTKPATDLVASWVHANNPAGGNRPYIIANLINSTSLLGAASGGYLAYVCTESNDVIKCRCRTAPPGQGIVVIPTELLPPDCVCNEGWAGCAP